MAFKKSQDKSGTKTRTMEQVDKPTRRLEDLGVGTGQGDGEWSTVESWFEDEDAEFSVPFTMIESFEYQDSDKRPKYGFGLKMEDSDDDAKYYVAFPATDKKGEPHKERQKLFKLLQDDSTPIAGCVMQRIDTGKANPYVRIISVEQMERIIASETESEESEED